MVEHEGGGVIVPHPNDRIKVHPTARLIVRGKLETNFDCWEGSPLTLIQLDENSVLEINGHVKLYYGCNIICRKGGHLTWESGFSNTMLKIRCAKRITIGEDAVFGPEIAILDSDFHKLSGQANMVQPVHIGNHVWLANRVTILKGVTIGDGAVVGAGAVVTKDVPAATLVAGNPARVIREGITWK